MVAPKSKQYNAKRYYAISCEDRTIYRSPGELAKKLNLDRSNVGKVLNGERDTVKGKHLIFVEKNSVDILKYKKEHRYKLGWLTDEDDEDL